MIVRPYIVLYHTSGLWEIFTTRNILYMIRMIAQKYTVQLSNFKVCCDFILSYTLSECLETIYFPQNHLHLGNIGTFFLFMARG